MKTRATLALAVAAGIPAAVNAQETFVVTYAMQEVLAGTATPSNLGTPGQITPGEGARLTITVEARLANGSSAINAATSYPAPFPPGGNGTGTVKGLGSVVYDILGDNGAASAAGTWSQRGGGVNPPFNQAVSTGTIPAGGDGSKLVAFGGAQVISPGGTASNVNTAVRVFIGTWTPASYANRTVNFLARGSEAVNPGQGNSLLLAYGYATAEDTDFNVFTYDLYLGKYVGANFGNGINVQVAPAPSSLALLGLGALVAGGRRRKA